MSLFDEIKNQTDINTRREQWLQTKVNDIILQTKGQLHVAANLGKREIVFSPGGHSLSQDDDDYGTIKYFNDNKFLQSHSIDEVYSSQSEKYPYGYTHLFIPTEDLQEIEKRVESYFRSEGFSQCNIKVVADEYEVETGGHKSFWTGKVIGSYKQKIVSDVKHLVVEIKW